MRTACLLLMLLAALPAAAAPGRCCMTDPQGWYFHPAEKIAARFRAYREIGVDTLRVEMDWRQLETSPGVWDLTAFRTYLGLVREHGFRVKLIVGALMGPPQWFVQQHPDALITDENGQVSLNTLSYWYPGLQALMTDKVRGIRQALADTGLADRVDFVIPALGPAGEAIYPVPWTLGEHVKAQTIWCYDVHARASFRAAMRAKYTAVADANRTWGTSYASWDEVSPPRPGERPGAMWHDLLTWYRDSKRSFCAWQVADLQRQFPRARALIYVSGTAYTPEHWQEAVRTGRGGDAIQMMADSFFLMDLAARTGSELQYTGCENEAEVRRLRTYLDARGASAPPMWGENAGFAGAAGNPGHLADVVLGCRLAGLDYTHAHFAFEADTVTPNAVMPLLKQAYARVAAAPPSKPRPGFRVSGVRPAGPELPAGVQRLDYAGVDGTPDWVLLLPPTRGADWMVNLHGHGSTGDQLYTRPDIRDLWLPAFRARGLGILTPNLRGNPWMSPEAASDLHALLQWMREKRGARRFLLVGGSMGGSSVLAYAAVHPEDVAGVIALCPASDIGAYAAWCATAEPPICREIGQAIRAAYAGEPGEIPQVYAARSPIRQAARLRMPLYVCHGALDAVIPVTWSRLLAKAMAGRAAFRYDEQPQGDHETPLHALPQALEWVLGRMGAAPGKAAPRGR